MAERRAITVHAFGDERVHLALAHHGRLKQGRLNTLCGRLAVTELSPFAAAAKASDRCRVCFGKVDDDGMVMDVVAPKVTKKTEPAPKQTAKAGSARRRGPAIPGSAGTARRRRPAKR